MWLVAASDGATGEMIAKGLALPVGESADIASMFAMYGLAVREGHDPAPYAKHIQAGFGRQGDAVVAFLESVRRGADLATARGAMPMMDLRSRLFAQNAVDWSCADHAPHAAGASRCRAVCSSASVNIRVDACGAGKRSFTTCCAARVVGLETRAHPQLTNRIDESSELHAGLDTPARLPLVRHTVPRRARDTTQVLDLHAILLGGQVVAIHSDFVGVVPRQT